MSNMADIENEELEGESTLDDKSSEYPDIVINLIKEQFSLFELKRRKEVSNKIQIDPDFQRGGVWDKKQKSELIESILMGIPLPIIYLFEDNSGTKQVVDGRQRLTTIFEYMNGSFLLSDLKMLKSENESYFNGLSPKYQSKIEDYQIQAYTILPPTPERVKFDIFDRVNRGGTRLNNQEMRNALYSGASTLLLRELAVDPLFLEATGNSVSSKRMKDRYIILRFLGFFLLRTNRLSGIEYKSDVDEFLADVMKAINGFSENEIQGLKDSFRVAMRNCIDVLGDDAFRFFNAYGNRRPVSMGLFECISYMLSNEIPDGTDLSSLKNRIESVKVEMDKSNMFGGRIDTTNGIKFRFDKADAIRSEFYD
ncbi:DUF262 domain-containing protein [Deefgea salmonis]|uniref:DUF262 domain-containing protein n=1 Tax=Deefgea salmonis TaxID=2875502 RepID=A0ABS8BJ15_9NEIS|nr:DUF262 domain-containing protein [Deefgea salmonis]MCB5195707.1 DUF262 domain-containing protein [Deefgea salmonis]